MRHAQHVGLVFLSIMALGSAAPAMPADTNEPPRVTGESRGGHATVAL
jgi:hypothetical protein